MKVNKTISEVQQLTNCEITQKHKNGDDIHAYINRAKANYVSAVQENAAEFMFGPCL
jgi:hypothetical protein